MSGQALKPVRLDRLLSNLGYGVRKDIASMAKAGLIVLDGEGISRADQKITPTLDLPDRLIIDDEPVDPMPGLILMLNKPVGVTCSRKDPGALVEECLPPRWRRRSPAISPVGRLDKDTSGMLLMTDDGQLNHRITSPKYHTPKVYVASLDRPLSGNEASVFASGELMLEGEDKPLLPAELQVINDHNVRLTLHEGRYHQVRRMFAAVGNHVTVLHRERIGGLALPDDLPPGDWRILTEADCASIFSNDKS